MLNKNQKHFFIKAAKMLVISVLVLAAFLITKAVLAQSLDLGMEYAAGTGLAVFDIRVMIARIIRIFLGLLGIIFVALVIYAGYLYMVSAGDPEKIKKSRKTIISAVIGLIIILSAYSIVSYILNSLLKATSGTQYATGEPYGSAGGALGGGIIESHYPPRNAMDVVRNTSIIVTFKEQMLPETIIEDTNGDGSYGGCVDKNNSTAYEEAEGECDLINKENIKIRKTADSATNGPFIENVKVSTIDNKTFVFKPWKYLGSESEKFWHEVLLGPGLKKENGQGAFGSFGSYFWQFQVGTELDLVPPQIVSVIPKPSTDPVAKNSVLQINFNEPINPITLTGRAKTTSEYVGDLTTDSFNYITIKYTQENKDYYVAGNFTAGNQYLSAEFITLDPCGINSCGEAVYCLPGNKTLTVLALSATLDDPALPTARFPYTGIVDLADNSLDGNRDGKATGPVSNYNLNQTNSTGGDNVSWSFATNDLIDLVPPQIESYTPAAGSLSASTKATANALFSKLMMGTSIKPDAGYGDGYCPCEVDTECASGETCSLTKGYCVDGDYQRIVCTPTIPCGGSNDCVQKEHATLIQPVQEGVEPRAYWLASQNVSNSKTNLIIAHEELVRNNLYSIRLGSGLKDLWQNCFQPAGGPGCVPEFLEPGQYQAKEGEWTIDPDTGLVDYPTCDLTNLDITSYGSLLLSYTGADNKNKLQTFSAFSSASITPVDFYNFTDSASHLEKWGDPFDNALAPKRTIFFLYHNQNTYHLFVVNNIGSNAGVGGQAAFTYEGTADVGIIYKDDEADTYTSGSAGSMSWDWENSPQTTDGAILNVAGETEIWTLTVNPGDFTNIDKIIFIYPGGAIELNQNKPFTISIGQ